MISIDKCIERNKAVGNKQGEIDEVLEINMLEEELRETAIALSSLDTKEVLDWCIDMIRVVVWTMHKYWFTEEQIIKWRDAVAESNNSKLIDGKALKDENGKIMKWPNYKKPDFSFLN